MANSKDYRDKMIELKATDERYNSLKEEVEGLSFLVRDKSDALDLIEMNKWLIKVINFYRDKNANINGYLFRNFYNSDVEDYDKRNSRINKYMELLFKNMNYPENYEFGNMVLNMKDMVISDTENPIYDEMVNVVDILNQRYSNINNEILRDISNRYIDLAIDNELFKFENINSLLKLIEERQRAISFMMDKLNIDMLNLLNNESINENINKVCDIVSLDREKDNSEQFNLRMLYMIELIARIRVFKELRVKYQEYSNNVNYGKIKEKVDNTNKDNKTFSNDIVKLKNKLQEVQKKTFIFRKKDSIINDINSHIGFLYKRIDENKGLNKERIKNYLLGFYDFCQLDVVEEQLEIEIYRDEERMLGVFDFDKLDDINLAISSVDLFKDLGIKLPDINSQEFDNLSRLCLDIIKKTKYSEVSKKR